MIDLTGQHFGRLVVIAETQKMGTQRAWLCECECGATKSIRGTSLRRGNTRSCGCGQGTKGLRRHGVSRDVEYNAYYNMLQRCQNPATRNYHNYGGRGIRVEFEDFDDFYAEVGPRPGPGYSIDRIDNEGHYTHGNLRWATKREQDNNRRNNRFIEYRGQRKTLQQWADHLGVQRQALYERITTGWSPEETVETPVGPYVKKRP